MKKYLIDTPSKNIIIVNKENLDRFNKSFIEENLKNKKNIISHFNENKKNNIGDIIVLPVKNKETVIEVKYSENKDFVEDIFIEDVSILNINTNKFVFEKILIYDLELFLNEWIYQQGDFEYQYKTGVFIELLDEDKKYHELFLNKMKEIKKEYKRINSNEKLQFIFEYEEGNDDKAFDEILVYCFKNDIGILFDFIYHESISLLDLFDNEYIYLNIENEFKGLTIRNINRCIYSIDNKEKFTLKKETD